MIVAPRAAIARIAPTKTIVTASPRRATPRRCNPSTAGLSARARKIATKIQIRTLCAAWTISIRTTPARMIPSTMRIARGRKRTRRSSIPRSLRSAADGAAQRVLKMNGPQAPPVSSRTSAPAASFGVTVIEAPVTFTSA